MACFHWTRGARAAMRPLDPPLFYFDTNLMKSDVRHPNIIPLINVQPMWHVKPEKLFLKNAT